MRLRRAAHPFISISSAIELQIDDETAGREYSSFEVILNDPDRKEQVVERALAEVDAWQARWLHYSEVFGGVFKAVDKVKKSKKISALIN